ncbi:MAG: hypothetical protein ACE5E5_14665, partial [Phycisphaerae bacterium]
STAVFDYYVANGTRIDLADLYRARHRPHAIDRTLLSPNANPFGAGLTNRYGIYVIECAGQAIEISDSRIVGTLVLLNPGAGSTVTRAVNMAPAVPSLPVLLVSGNFAFSFRSDRTVEERSKVNLNPIGTPYLGIEDADAIDSYPSYKAWCTFPEPWYARTGPRSTALPWSASAPMSSTRSTLLTQERTSRIRPRVLPMAAAFHPCRERGGAPLCRSDGSRWARRFRRLLGSAWMRSRRLESRVVARA